eukprot:CAMPEP_0116126306 /NCGR_PEP_ID=MMETSP0329-20121206/6266_1 /TAXON_ID=697910 /ORGANISM="Pseudo-nitzschia arenysensis, Strain B593" /LENGTH=174 /DNA_ID=CAMNT_0003620389 /DNA_START=148 /DNA_END=672 /DNA_ORIENTATION=+
MSDPYLLTALGVGSCMLLTSLGSAMGSAAGGIYAVKGPSLKMLVPIVQAGVLAIYGLIIACMLFKNMESDSMTYAQGCKNLAAGLSVGASCLASGWGMSAFVKQLNEGVSLSAAPAVETTASESTPLIPSSSNDGAGIYGKDVFIKTVLSLIYLEAIGLYGLIVALFLVYNPST